MPTDYDTEDLLEPEAPVEEEPVQEEQPSPEVLQRRRFGVPDTGGEFVYQPPAAPNPRRQLEAMAHLYKNRSIDEANKAVIAARSLIGARLFQKDIEEGKAPHEALARWGPDIFSGRIQSWAPQTKAFAPPPGPPKLGTVPGVPPYLVDPRGIPHFAPRPDPVAPTGPVEGRPVTVDGKPVPGLVAVPGPRGTMNIHKAATEGPVPPSNSQKLKYYSDKLKEIDSAITTGKAGGAATPAGQALLAERKRIASKRDALMGEGTASPMVEAGRTNTPEKAESPSRYKVGAVYKGGLKYLGGDPNDEASWERVK